MIKKSLLALNEKISMLSTQMILVGFLSIFTAIWINVPNVWIVYITSTMFLVGGCIVSAIEKLKETK